MNVIAEVQGDSVLLSTAHTDERGRLAARLLAHTDDPRTVQKVTGRRGAPGAAYRVPLAVAEAAGFLIEEPEPDDTPLETATRPAPELGKETASTATGDSPSPTAPPEPAPGTPAPADSGTGDTASTDTGDDTPVPPKKTTPAKKAAPRTPPAKKE